MESPEVQASRSIGEEEEEWDLRYSPSPGSGEGWREVPEKFKSHEWACIWALGGGFKLWRGILGGLVPLTFPPLCFRKAATPRNQAV